MTLTFDDPIDQTRDDRPIPAAARIVLLDDDPHERTRLSDAMLRSDDRWDVRAVSDPDDATALLATGIDVLVASTGLANGAIAPVLAAVRDRSPRTARVVLSDHLERGAVLNVLGAAHQCLPRPVDPAALASVIERVCGTTAELSEPACTLIGQVDRLPSPPAIYQRLTSILATDRWRLDEVADEIRHDVALTGEILKLVNSSFFGTSEKVTSVDRAISLVGIDLIRFVVLGNKLYQSNGQLERWLDLDRLHQRSTAVARAAHDAALADGADTADAATAFLAGMVSEIGVLVLGQIPVDSPSISQPLNAAAYPGVERALFGGDRFEVGARLLRLWGFDDDMVDAVSLLSVGDGPAPGGLPDLLARARRIVTATGGP